VTKEHVKDVKLNSTSTAKFCEAYVEAKAMCQSFLKETSHEAKKYGKVIHTNLWGPASWQVIYPMLITFTISLAVCPMVSSFTPLPYTSTTLISPTLFISHPIYSFIL